LLDPNGENTLDGDSHKELSGVLERNLIPLDRAERVRLALKAAADIENSEEVGGGDVE
jgi:hypothetical protein